jgi:hypothetical protein
VIVMGVVIMTEDVMAEAATMGAVAAAAEGNFE